MNAAASERAASGEAAALSRLADLLRAERAAAIAADLDALERIQDEKRALVDEIAADAEIPQAELRRVIEGATRNRALLEQLVELHRALASEPAEPTYTARGLVRAPSAPPVARIRRAL